jgi:hypothetical protein
MNRFAWLAGYAVASLLAFPHPVGGRVLDLGLGAGWLAPAALLLGLAGLGVRRAAWLGFLASLAAHSAILHWIYVVTVEYGHAPPAVGVLAPIALASYIAAFGALFGAGVALVARSGVVPPFAAALLWTALDHLRSFALSGFPWATLGYAQHQNAALLPLASLGGVYALSFVTVLGGASLAPSCTTAGRGGRFRPGRRRAGTISWGIWPRATNERTCRACAGRAPGQHRPGGQVEPRVGRGHAPDLRGSLAAGRRAGGARDRVAGDGSARRDRSGAGRASALRTSGAADRRGARGRRRGARFGPARSVTDGPVTLGAHAYDKTHLVPFGGTTAQDFGAVRDGAGIPKSA